jgi:serine/threonine protein kinase/tetratricopeptide (TPR) repeat protein
MDFAGLSDSAGTISSTVPKCRCGATARIIHGLCVACLLRGGLRFKPLSAENFEAVLAEIDISDRDWQVGHYRILEEIGRGGMGVIYRARQQYSRRIVALKRVLRYHSDSRETMMRFQREAQAAASLDHPNILPIYEVGMDEEGLPFFTMKLATGGSLLQNAIGFLHRPRQIVQLLAKVSRAVDYAHKQGILHRDLKPGNILLDGRGEALISDFGLARWIDSGADLTQSVTVFGTPGYIAPEQVLCPSSNLTPAVDVYSLGAILFELLSGRPPFVAEHAIAVINQAAQREAPKLRSIDRTLARDLETICARCLEREPSGRYASAGELAEELERWVEGRSILTRPISPPVRLWRWSCRNRALATSFAGCVILGSAAMSWQFESRHFEATVNNEASLRHSIAILPFLNLDTVGPDADTSQSVDSAIQQQMLATGPSRVVALTQSVAKWTGTGNYDEVRRTAQQTKSRAVLVGTSRRTGGQTRVSLHLISENGSDVLGHWTLAVKSADELPQALTAAAIGIQIYRTLDQQNGGPIGASVDPVMTNEISRGYFSAGRGLLDRRTIPDMDRAIICFEQAARAAPYSVTARSYLALAYMGRNFLSADPKYMESAFRAAREAYAMSPEDPSPNRALCALYIETGQLDDALEHGFRALESGDPSERAFGQIAFIWKELGHPERAIRWFREAKVSERQPADYEALLGDCWMLLDERGKAQEAYNAAQNFHPDLPDGFLGLAHLTLRDGNYDEARSLFEQRSAEFVQHYTTKPLLAQIEFFARNFREAERLYREIHQSNPHGVGKQQYGAISSTSALARLKIASGDLRTANKLLRESFTIDQGELSKAPRNPEVLYRLAADEAIRGNTTAALTYFQASIAAGWIDYRSPRLDPRFDHIANTPEFQKTISELAAHVATLNRLLLAGSQSSY